MKAAGFINYGISIAIALLIAGSNIAGAQVHSNGNRHGNQPMMHQQPGHHPQHHHGNEPIVQKQPRPIIGDGRHSSAERVAERKANDMRRQLRLDERTYRKVFDFYLKEARRGPEMTKGFEAREEHAMKRILTRRQYRLWIELDKGHYHRF